MHWRVAVEAPERSVEFDRLSIRHLSLQSESGVLKVRPAGSTPAVVGCLCAARRGPERWRCKIAEGEPTKDMVLRRCHRYRRQRNRIVHLSIGLLD